MVRVIAIKFLKDAVHVSSVQDVVMESVDFAVIVLIVLWLMLKMNLVKVMRKSVFHIVNALMNDTAQNRQLVIIVQRV